MTVPAPHRVYRSLVRLYPRSFRLEYGDDLVQHFGDLAADRGRRAAWTRTGVDLIVTLPRYRLERVMTEQRSATTINVAIAVLAAGGVMSVLTGASPGVVLILMAIVLGVAQRGTLARALRTPDSNRRRRRLGTAAILGVVFLATMGSYLRAIGDEHVSGTSLLLHNAIGVPAMVGATVFLIVGLLTPRAPEKPAVTR
jgi:hypothetical protein